MNIKEIIIEEIIDKRSDKEKVIEFIKRFIGLRYHPYMLKTRGGGRSGISSATAYQVKILVDLLPKLSDIDIQDIKQTKYKNPRTGNEDSFEPYINQIQSLGNLKQSKSDIKNISKDEQYSTLIQEIKEKIEDFLKEQELKIDESIKKNWKHIHEQYQSMSREDFNKKYGDKKTSGSFGGQPAREYYSMVMFQASYLGVLLRTNIDNLPEFILKTQKAYRDKEYGKIDALIYKLKVRFPNLTEFQMTNFRKSIDGIEFTLIANSPEGQVNIYTQTIYAGGYNIQKLHLRWLMHVTDIKGNKVKIEV